jgi:hypothetical protein
MSGPTPARLSRLRAAAQERTRRLILVLEDVHKARNLGALLRTCDALGIQEIFDSDGNAVEGATGAAGGEFAVGGGGFGAGGVGEDRDEGVERGLSCGDPLEIGTCELDARKLTLGKAAGQRRYGRSRGTHSITLGTR